TTNAAIPASAARPTTARARHIGASRRPKSDNSFAPCLTFTDRRRARFLDLVFTVIGSSAQVGAGSEDDPPLVGQSGHLLASAQDGPRNGGRRVPGTHDEAHQGAKTERRRSADEMHPWDARLETWTQARITPDQIQVGEQLPGEEGVPGDIHPKTRAEHN